MLEAGLRSGNAGIYVWTITDGDAHFADVAG